MPAAPSRTIIPPACPGDTLFSESIRIAMRLVNARYLARHAEATATRAMRRLEAVSAEVGTLQTVRAPR